MPRSAEDSVYHRSRPGTGSSLYTPADALMATPARALYIEGAGNIKCTFADGSVDTWAVPAFFYMAMEVLQVWSTGTTATGIHVIY